MENGTKIYLVHPNSLITEKGHNIRDFESDRTKEHIETLAENIVENGILTALECQRVLIEKKDGGKPKYKYIIIDGECRYRAINILLEKGIKIDSVPVVLEKSGYSDANRILDLLNANLSLRFSPIELATAYKKLIELGWTTNEIAKKISLSIEHITGCYELLTIDWNNKPTMIESPKRKTRKQGNNSQGNNSTKEGNNSEGNNSTKEGNNSEQGNNSEGNNSKRGGNNSKRGKYNDHTYTNGIESLTSSQLIEKYQINISGARNAFCKKIKKLGYKIEKKEKK